MKVFLGGTCSGYDWRKNLIKQLKCDYYNPIVKNWTKKDRLRERENCDYLLYVITSDIKGYYSIAEVVDDSNKRPEKTIFCILESTFKTNVNKLKNLKTVEKLVQENEVIVFNDLKNIATYLNNINDAIINYKNAEITCRAVEAGYLKPININNKVTKIDYSNEGSKPIIINSDEDNKK